MSAARALGVAAVFFAGLAAGELHAGPPPTAGATAMPASALSLRASPVFGTDAACGEGWLELITTVDNPGSVPLKGTLEIESSYGAYSGGAMDSRFLARAPFHVQPRAEAVLRIPVRGATYSIPNLTISAVAEGGGKLAETSVSLGTSLAPLLVDIDEPSRLSLVMRGWPMTPGWRPPASPYASPGTTTALTVGSPAVDGTTGDVILPEHAAGYSSATVVVVPSERLARLQGAELDALVGWVLGGGTLAVFPTRPEDLRAGVLTTLVGGGIATVPPPAVMMTLPGAYRSGGAPSFAPGSPPTPAPWGPSVPSTPPGFDAGSATPIGWVVPVRTTPLGASAAIGPSSTLRPRLVGYSGGNLRASEYGATATYGLGQVHVLGFDPTTSPALEDPWMQGRILDMVNDAWDRHALVAFPDGAGARGANLYDVHRALDPNENFRPALGIAAILLVIYSIAVGPLTFMRAHRRGRPLDPLVWAPVTSAACFALIVLVGLAGKGWSGRARHIALVEAGAGMSRGSVRRFRGFFASQTRAMRVRASEPASVLEVVTTDSHSQGAAVLRLDKEGASLEELTSLPWQTVVVSEDGFTELGGGIAVREKADGSVVVANHSGRDLENVLVWAPKTDATYFARIAAGDTILSSSGRTVFTASSRRPATAGTRTVHILDPSRFTMVLGHSLDDMMTQWSAMSSAAGGSATDWWPDDVPVVMGELHGGEGVKVDGGLRVESDVLLFRVVGEGGAT